jgi:GTP:adenosylcobinamide-phosphate guanylyltransferase
VYTFGKTFIDVSVMKIFIYKEMYKYWRHININLEPNLTLIKEQCYKVLLRIINMQAYVYSEDEKEIFRQWFYIVINSDVAECTVSNNDYVNLLKA